MTLHRLFRGALTAVAWMMLAGPVQAQSVQFENVRYDGTYQGTVPGGVVVRTPGGDAILPQGLSFTVGGQRIDIGSLNPGSLIQVPLPTGIGQVVGGSGNTVFVQYPNGVFPVPGNCVPDTGVGKTKVTVLKPNGKTVQVPLNAALNMQRSQGAVILGNTPLGGWPSGHAGPGVYLGNQGEHVLLQTVVNGVPQLVRVPRGQAGQWTNVALGTTVDVTPGSNGLGHSQWKPGKGHGNAGGQGQGKGNSGKSNGNGGGNGKGKNK